ncbi:lysylphosphatidylglycerol synthase transmembrane domain-containing protein [Nakamurella lactea]|uniref:lysylphosphatidylglycerol synthase transmembrane domain-containing protein n=1 Tax=Nakamurella lactea TaxID=459515 RepID=UPI00041C8A4E|nr:lysylphosphatidylglycerol synthase transmembrane domain-containing protein [Nakamurella lactea]
MTEQPDAEALDMPPAASPDAPVGGTGRGGRRRKLAALSVVVGTVLALACLWFVGAQFARDWNRSKELLANARWAWLILAVPLALTGMTMLGMVWRSVLAALGTTVRRRQLFVWYQIGMLGKYIPGGIVQVVGRAELATRGGVPRSTAYNSVALSMGATYICGALVSAILLPFALADRGSVGSIWWILLVIPIGLAALHPKVLGLLFRLAEKAFGGADDRQVPSWGASVVLVARHAPGWLVNGLACWVCALAFAPSAPIGTVVFAGIISWVGGFLVIFVPSGAGVREAMFVALAAPVIGGPAAAATAIVSRLVFVLGDVLGALLAVLVRQLTRRPPPLAP